MIRASRHKAHFLVAIAACAASLSACEPDWSGKGSVQRPPVAPLQVVRPATVTVYSGDTVFSIARRYNLSVRDLIDVNGLEPPYLLTPGTVLRLSGIGTDYIVQKGDTLLGLARRFKIDFNTLAAVNGKKSPYGLFAGERLTLPAAKGEGNTLVVTSPSATGGGAPPVAPPPAAATASPVTPVPPPPPPPRDGSYASLQSREPAPSAAPPPPHGDAAPPPAAGQASPTPAPPAAEIVPPARAAGTFLWPVKGEIVAEFGPLPGKGQHNDGINIAAPRGTPVKAAENGVVVYVGNELKGFGNLLLVKHADGWMTAYAHNDQLKVRRGDKVRRGQVIATVGSSGNVTQPQLHFELRRGTDAVNPVEHLQDRIAWAESVTNAAFP
jgi:murein DD-endopeptidase MepM/ murein hydrolase activator NlpD